MCKHTLFTTYLIKGFNGMLVVEASKSGSGEPLNTVHSSFPLFTHTLTESQLFIYLLRPQHSSSQWCRSIFRFDVGCRCCSTQPGHSKQRSVFTDTSTNSYPINLWSPVFNIQHRIVIIMLPAPPLLVSSSFSSFSSQIAFFLTGPGRLDQDTKMACRLLAVIRSIFFPSQFWPALKAFCVF